MIGHLCSSLFVAGVLLLTVASDLVLSYTECPPETIRLVSTDDIKDANVTMGTGFKNVLTTSTLMEEAFRYFLETAVPNTGEILFKEEFLLTGITTAGFKLNSTDPDRFVSNFTFLYSSFTTGPFQKYEMCFTPDNAMETAYFLSNPLLARRIRLIVNDAELGLGTYYWRINLFGCSEEDGVDTNGSGDAPAAQTRTTDTVTSTQSHLYTDLHNYDTVTSTSVRTVPRTTASPSYRDCTPPIRISSSCYCNCYISVIVVLVLFVLLVIAVIAWIVTLCCCLCRKRRSNAPAVRERSDTTVREVQNVPLNTMENEEKGTVSNLVKNESYNTTDITGTSSGIEVSTSLLPSSSSSTQLIPPDIKDEVVYTDEMQDDDPSTPPTPTT